MCFAFKRMIPNASDEIELSRMRRKFSKAAKLVQNKVLITDIDIVEAQ